MNAPSTTRSFRQADREVLQRLQDAGLASRLFPHRVTFLKKCGPDAIRLARLMCGDVAVEDIWLALLHADPESLQDLPQDVDVVRVETSQRRVRRPIRYLDSE